MLAGRTMFRRLIWASLSVVALAGCKSERAAPAEDAAKFRRTAVTPQFPSEAVIHERSGTGSVRYLGMDVDPRTPERGAVVTVTHYFEVVRPMIGAYDVFVHSELPGGGGRALVATGIAIALPEGYAGLVQPRSGLAFKHGVTVLNTPGLIDSGYRGELKVCLINHDPTEPFEVTRGERIAQLVVQAVEHVTFVEVDTLDDSERGDKGFGSSGR